MLRMKFCSRNFFNFYHSPLPTYVLIALSDKDDLEASTIVDIGTMA